MLTRRLLTTREVAELLACPPRYVRVLIRQGRLQFMRLTPRGAYRIDAASVEALMPSDAKVVDGIDYACLAREAMARVERRLQRPDRLR